MGVESFQQTVSVINVNFHKCIQRFDVGLLGATKVLQPSKYIISLFSFFSAYHVSYIPPYISPLDDCIRPLPPTCPGYFLLRGYSSETNHILSLFDPIFITRGKKTGIRMSFVHVRRQSQDYYEIILW